LRVHVYAEDEVLWAEGFNRRSYYKIPV